MLPFFFVAAHRKPRAWELINRPLEGIFLVRWPWSAERLCYNPFIIPASNARWPGIAARENGLPAASWTPTGGHDAQSATACACSGFHGPPSPSANS